MLFGDTDITVQEDAGVVTLQVTALGLLETSLTVIVTTQDGTAEGNYSNTSLAFDIRKP